MKYLTISVAAYNVEQYIEKCIGSIAECDSIQDIELLVINDGSKDNTSKIAHEFEKKWGNSIRCIDKENGGHGSTINEGIRQGTGKYFMVLDGDDWLDAKVLDKLVHFLKTTDTDLILLNSVRQYETGGNDRIEEYKEYLYNKSYSEEDFAKNTNIKLSSSIIKLQLLKESGLSCSEKCFYDDLQYDTFITFLSKKFIYLDLYLYQYRIGRPGQSISIESFRRNIDMQIHMLDVLLEFCDAHIDDVVENKKYPLVSAISRIERSIVGTLLSFSPNNLYKKKLFDNLDKIRNSKVDTYICNINKKFKYVSRLKIYYVLSYIYRFTHKYKD